MFPKLLTFDGKIEMFFMKIYFLKKYEIILLFYTDKFYFFLLNPIKDNNKKD